MVGTPNDFAITLQNTLATGNATLSAINVSSTLQVGLGVLSPESSLTLAITGTQTGTMTLSVNVGGNVQTTSILSSAGTLTNSYLQSALQSLTNVGVGNVLVTSSAANTYTITFVGNMIAQVPTVSAATQSGTTATFTANVVSSNNTYSLGTTLGNLAVVAVGNDGTLGYGTININPGSGNTATLEDDPYNIGTRNLANPIIATSGTTVINVNQGPTVNNRTSTLYRPDGSEIAGVLGTLNLTGNIAGTGAISKNGPGTLNYTGLDLNTGTLTINGGPTVLSGNGQITSNTVNVNQAGPSDILNPFKTTT